MENHKVLFVGPVGSGKTTAVISLCGSDIITTSKKITDKSSSVKNDTTVSMDYGVLNINNKYKLHIYSAPGQNRFSFMTDILTEGVIGVIILISVVHTPISELADVLNEYLELIENHACIVGLTHISNANDEYIAQFMQAIKQYNSLLSDILVKDVRRKDEALSLVESLIMKASKI